MPVPEMFEDWACRNVAFQELDDVWPYLLEDRFGAACLEIMSAESLAGFDADDCLRVASKASIADVVGSFFAGTVLCGSAQSGG